MDLITIILVAIAAIVIIALLLTNIRVVPQAKAFVIERLGAYDKTWPVGLHVKLPIVDRVAAVGICLSLILGNSLTRPKRFI